MTDESKRQAYDLIWPSLTRRRTAPQTAQKPHSPPASATQPESFNERAQIDAIHTSKQERNARWRIQKNVLDSSIFELQRGIRQLEQEIKNLNSILDAEAAVEAQKNSWGTWLLSSISKKAEDTEEEKERKDRERQVRKISRDMKERRVEVKKGDLKKAENTLRKSEAEINTANLGDETKIRVIQAGLRAREFQQRQERDRERMPKIWKQQQEEQVKRERDAASELRRQQAEKQAADQKRRDEASRKWQDALHHEFGGYRTRSTRQAYTSPCNHDGWWPKVQGRTACPECHEIWTYLLQCPGCQMKGCPKCQARLRPRMRGYTARTNRKGASMEDVFESGY